MRRFIIGGLLIAVMGLVSASRAQADGVDTFTYTFDGNTFVWQLPSSPTIGAMDFILGTSFAILDVPYSENGMAQAPSEFDFFSSTDEGGFQIITPSLMSPANTFGAQLYGGMDMEDAPTFIPGTYQLNNDSPTGPTGTLVISFSSVSAPEPSSLILLGSGLLSLLGFARKKLLA
jgi:hypothetical protein